MKQNIITMIISIIIISLSNILQYVFQVNEVCIFIVVFTCNLLTAYFVNNIIPDITYIIMLMNISILFALCGGFSGIAIIIGNILKQSTNILLTFANKDFIKNT